MVLRCSLLGHEYGEPDVEREREERGSEVVVTVREYEECARCGKRTVVSENTEVTSLETVPSPDEVDEQNAGETIDTHRAERGVDDRGNEIGSIGDDSGDDGIIIGDGVDQPEAESDTPAAEADADAVSTPEDIDVPLEETEEPIVDDGEILETDDEVGGDRAHGEWPESPDVGPPLEPETEPTAWPEDDREVEVEETAESPVENEVGASTTENQPAEEESRKPNVAETGFTSAGSVPAPGESAPVEDVLTELFCPQCTFAAPGDRGSLRPGDICPECRRGYLGERER